MLPISVCGHGTYLLLGPLLTLCGFIHEILIHYWNVFLKLLVTCGYLECVLLRIIIIIIIAFSYKLMLVC